MNTTLTIKLPTSLRNDAKATAAELGLPLTTIIQHQLREFIEKREITFTAPVVFTAIDAVNLSKGASADLANAKKLENSQFLNI